MPCPPAVRVIVRLPYNRPEDAPSDPPRVEWNAEKEKVLWEVIAQSRAIEGAATDWKGLAEHLRVPLAYILYRAQARYEEDLRGLQGLGIRSPAAPFPSAPSPQRTNVQGEYFPLVHDSPLPLLPLRDVAHARMGSSSSAADGLASTSGTVPGTSTLRPLGVRARLSSLGTPRAHAQVRSSVHADPIHSPLAGLPIMNAAPPLRQTKKISSSSTITLQGPRRTRTPLRRLSPTSSRADSSSAGSDSDDSDEQTREEEAERQETLSRKLEALKNMMTSDTLGLVADPARARAKQRGRARPISGASTSAVSLSSSDARRSSSMSRSHGRQSLSSASVDSRQGSIPSIPSPPAIAPRPVHAHQQAHTQSRRFSHPQRPPMRGHSQSLITSQSLSQSRSTTHSTSSAQSPSRVTSPMPVPRHLSTPSTSPPALSPGRAVGQTHVQSLRHAAAGLTAVSGTVSEASSFSDLSDADLSSSALESALMSNTRGSGSRLSSARTYLSSGRRATRG
ncbi:hypothetical protein VTO73DRAFT_3589 [Trametes versicolor]